MQALKEVRHFCCHWCDLWVIFRRQWLPEENRWILTLFVFFENSIPTLFVQALSKLYLYYTGNGAFAAGILYLPFSALMYCQQNPGYIVLAVAWLLWWLMAVWSHTAKTTKASGRCACSLISLNSTAFVDAKYLKNPKICRGWQTQAEVHTNCLVSGNSCMMTLKTWEQM